MKVLLRPNLAYSSESKTMKKQKNESDAEKKGDEYTKENKEMLRQEGKKNRKKTSFGKN
jgi:hypothetical protein